MDFKHGKGFEIQYGLMYLGYVGLTHSTMASLTITVQCTVVHQHVPPHLPSLHFHNQPRTQFYSSIYAPILQLPGYHITSPNTMTSLHVVVGHIFSKPM